MLSCASTEIPYLAWLIDAAKNLMLCEFALMGSLIHVNYTNAAKPCQNSSSI